MHSYYIAWQYLKFNKVKTVTIILCITVILLLPLSLKVLIDEAELQLRSRAIATPLLIGKTGSAMDLTLSSLYFIDDIPPPITMAVNQEIIDSGLAHTIPLYRKFKADGFPIIGTSIDYFEFRGNGMAQGRAFLYLGECVLGSAVAAKLNLQPGDDLLSSSENLFDLVSHYPLKMTVSGILDQSHSADDHAVFVDTKTAWVLDGLGHGHNDLKNSIDPDVILNRDDKHIRANAKLMHYNEISGENMKDFHFHGDMARYPLTAVIAIPHNGKSEAILKGRFLQTEITQQVVSPKMVINTLLERIFQIKKLIDGTGLLVSLTTLLALVLVFALSVRLREREFETLFKLGCASTTMARLLIAEIFLVLIASFVLTSAFLMIVWSCRDAATRLLLLN